jgi:hypothetical protein
MISDYLNQDGYRVQKFNWELYDDTSAATLTLTGNTPAVVYRLRITLSSITGHADCAGTMTINGSEVITFAQASTKTTTTNLIANALPIVTTANLDCRVLIEVLSTGGAVLQEETQTALDCRFQDSQKSFRLPSGEFSMSDAIAYTDDSSCAIGTKFSFGSYDYSIAQVTVMTALDGTEEGRKLWLTGKAAAPTGRTVVDVTDYMLKSVYDIDSNGIADKADGIPVLSALPTDLSAYSAGDQFMVGNKKYTITDE